MDKEDLRKQSSLGKDFLTYLCYKSDQSEGQVGPDQQDQQHYLWLDGKIVMEDDKEPPPNTVAHSGEDFSDRDLKQAIRAGKKVREARFRVEQGAHSWLFTLKAERFEIAGFKCDMPKTNDLDERFYDRMLNIEALTGLLDGLYNHFINDVLQKTWQASGYKEFQQWLKAK